MRNPLTIRWRTLPIISRCAVIQDLIDSLTPRCHQQNPSSPSEGMCFLGSVWSGTFGSVCSTPCLTINNFSSAKGAYCFLRAHDCNEFHLLCVLGVCTCWGVCVCACWARYIFQFYQYRRSCRTETPVRFLEERCRFCWCLTHSRLR